ncbi:ZPR1 zinc finger domain-containing protein [Candidatus Woesearchaeota archaeon]|nr:ZPR1 zinc finger domain-containing protein [Candidatus Woesearchaeota archaeon]
MAKKTEQKKPDKKSDEQSSQPDIVTGETCPMCMQKTATLSEHSVEVPYFGKIFVFSLICTNKGCNYKIADVEAEQQKEPCKYTIEVDKEEDMKIRFIKSSQATVKIPHMATITPGPASDGYISNIEGLLNRVKDQVESAKDDAEDEEDKNKAKNLLKKLIRVMWGQEKLKIIVEDPSGNSAIISEKAVKSKL